MAIKTYSDTIHTATIGILGLGREGQSTLDFLLCQPDFDASIAIFDTKSLQDLPANIQQIVSSSPAITYTQLTTETAAKWAVETLYKTPGIPLSYAAAHNIEFKHLSSNTQLFFETILSKFNHQQVQTIGITGTKGKSTTTAFLDHLLNVAGWPHLTGGNMGIAPLDLWERLKSLVAEKSHFATVPQQPIMVVLELSSHQLAELPYSPNTAIIQHIFPEHLDYYATFEEYYQAKSAICRFQTERDLVLFNTDSDTATALAAESPAKKLPFDKNSLGTELQKMVTLLGEHNLYNIAPAVLWAKHHGVADEVIQKAVTTFEGLSHRLESAGTKAGVWYINDSQATNPEAAIAALRSFEARPLVVIAGGYDKQLDMTPFVLELLRVNAKALVLFPTVGQKIYDGLKKMVNENQDSQVRERAAALLAKTSYPVDGMAAAVAAATAAAQSIIRSDPASQPVVLMSPACASFGMFESYIDRGNQFKQAVTDMA